MVTRGAPPATFSGGAPYESVRLYPTEPLEALGALLKRTRLEKRVSQRVLADFCHVNVSVVSRAERGENATIATWMRLFGGLGCDLRFEAVDACEESLGWVQEESERRRDRRAEGLCVGKRRFY